MAIDLRARQHLDERFKRLPSVQEWQRPPRGWIRAIREALGMTNSQLALRLRVTQPRIGALERAEVSGAVTLESLEKAARALNCTLVYALIPNQPLEEQVQRRAREVADQQLTRVDHTMRLEKQGLAAGALAEERARLAAELAKTPRRLWDRP